MRIVIIGAGPTGLGAAYRLQELGHEDWQVYEASDHVGGLASSVESNGFVYDTGGHVLFSHYKYFDDLVDKLLGDQFTEINREAWICMDGRWVPYPFQNNLRYLDIESAVECVMGLAGERDNPADAENFKDWILSVFGEGISRLFMLPYNWKVWAHPLHLMDKQWMAERVSIVELKSTLRNILSNADDSRWGPNSTFKFPLRGGTGGLYQPFLPYVRDHLRLNTCVEAIDTEARRIYLSDGAQDRYDVLINTMPLTELVPRLTPVSTAITGAVQKLSWSGGMFVGLGIAKPCPSEKCWVYFPEANVPFYRMTYLSRYSPYMAPDDQHFSIVTETSVSSWKPVDRETIIEETIEGLIATGILTPEDRQKIVDRTLIETPYSYPTPTLERGAALAIVQPYLMSKDIYSRGRFGAWLYEIGNMDHSVMQGVEVANLLLLGEPESTWIPPKDVTVEARI